MTNTASNSEFTRLARNLLQPHACIIQIGAADGIFVDPVNPLIQVRPETWLDSEMLLERPNRQ